MPETFTGVRLNVSFPCKEIFDDYSKMVAGGGLALSLLMAVFISLLGTPAMTSAAESSPVSASVTVDVDENPSSASFFVTVAHSDGSVVTSYVRVPMSTESSGTVTYYMFAIESAKILTSVQRAEAQFFDMSGEPGVVLGFTGPYVSGKRPLSGVGYNPSTACVQTGIGCLTVALKDKPQTESQVVQMPTTGAPTGLTTVGVIALGLCLLGVTVLARRRG